MRSIPDKLKELDTGLDASISEGYQDIDPFEATEGIKSSQVSEKDVYDFRRNMVNNITSFANGEFPGGFAINGSQISMYDAEEVARV